MGEREGSEGQEREGGALPFTLRDIQLGTVRPRRSERTTWSLLDHLLAFGCGRTPLTQSTKVVRGRTEGAFSDRVDAKEAREIGPDGRKPRRTLACRERGS